MTYTMQQNGYRAAGLAAFLPAFAVLDPAVGSLLGLFVYHEHLGGGPVRIIIEVAAALAATWGIARLASLSTVPPVSTVELTGADVLVRPEVIAMPVPVPIPIPVVQVSELPPAVAE